MKYSVFRHVFGPRVPFWSPRTPGCRITDAGSAVPASWAIWPDFNNILTKLLIFVPLLAFGLGSYRAYFDAVNQAERGLRANIALLADRLDTVLDETGNTLTEAARMAASADLRNGAADAELRGELTRLSRASRLLMVGIVDADADIAASDQEGLRKIVFPEIILAHAPSAVDSASAPQTRLSRYPDDNRLLVMSRSIHGVNNELAGTVFALMDIGESLTFNGNPGLRADTGISLFATAAAEPLASWPDAAAARLPPARSQEGADSPAQPVNIVRRSNVLGTVESLQAVQKLRNWDVFAVAVRSGASIGPAWLHPAGALSTLAAAFCAGAFVLLRAPGKRPKEEVATAATDTSKSQYQAIFENAPNTLFVATKQPDGRSVFTDISPNSHKMIGIDPVVAIGKSPEDLFLPGDAGFVTSMHDRCIASQALVQSEHEVRLPTGRTYWEIRLLPLPTEAGQPKQVVGSIRNITQQKQLAHNLKRVTGQLLGRQDQERRQIARDLHDSAAQTLWAASMEISKAAGAMPASSGAAHALNLAREYISQTQLELRTVSYLLHPPLLEEAGLSRAIPWFLEGFSSRTGLSVSSTIAEPLAEMRLPFAIEIALFRIVQEALANVHRHARAKTATVNLSMENRLVQLTILDDGLEGRSLAVLRREVREGVGIGGMRSRLRALDGSLSVQFTDHGTMVHAKLALPEGYEPVSSS